MILEICLECGTTSVLTHQLGCMNCGSWNLDQLPADDTGLAALDNAWLDGRIDDHRYELIQSAVRWAIDSVNDEWQDAEDEGGLGAIPEAYQPIAEAVEPKTTEPKRYIKLRLRSVTLKEAQAFVAAHHRHHKKPPHGWKFGIGIEDEAGNLRGVAMVGRPVSRIIQEREPGTLEVNRCCVLPDTPNGASMLYAAALKAARAIKGPDGRPLYNKLITYILESETGTSLKACGWTQEHRTRGKSWNTKSRPREDHAPTCNKTRWSRRAS